MSDLENVKGVGRITAEKLRKAGLNTVPQLAKANVRTMVKKTGFPESIALRLIGAAKEARKVVERPQERRKKGKRVLTASQVLKSVTPEQLLALPSFKKQLLARVMTTPSLRQKIVRNTVKELFD